MDILLSSPSQISSQWCCWWLDLIDDMLLRLYYVYEKLPKKCRELEGIITVLKECFEFDYAGVRPVRASGSQTWVAFVVTFSCFGSLGWWAGHWAPSRHCRNPTGESTGCHRQTGGEFQGAPLRGSWCPVRWYPLWIWGNGLICWSVHISVDFVLPICVVAIIPSS